MRFSTISKPALACCLFCLNFTVIPARAALPARQMADAANKWLASLTAEQRAQAVYEFKDEQRFDWHFVPKPRKGLPFKEMTPPQRALAHTLLSSGLSVRGLIKATNIMSLEYILFDLEAQSPTRDAGLYFVTVFGKPGPDPWGWRVEGHHLSLNFAVAGDHVLSVTPSFFGANPAQVQEGPRKGLRALPNEEDLARQLVKSLDPEQRKTALFATDAPRDIITGNSRKAKALEPVGISAAKLTKSQKDLLLRLLQEYVFRYRHEIAEEDLKKIQQQGDEKIYFAWAGGLEPGEGHYYRIQGPTFLMEYDNTQNHANHIHTVWRDLENDFGQDLLRQHYEQTPHPK